MDMKPILTFNEPVKDGKRGKLGGGGGKPHTPGTKEQAKRIMPKVEQLERNLAEHVQLSGVPDGLLPEKVLVLEIAGDVQNLVKSLSKVPGLEMLSQSILDTHFQDKDYYAEKDGKIKPVTKNAYLAMSNQTGLRRLKTMWNKYVSSGHIDKGYAPLRYAFLQLTDIRFWDTQDRLEATYLLEDWQYRLKDAAQGYDELISFEIELWFRPNSLLRGQAEAHIRDVIEKSGGNVVNTFVHEGIEYHGLLGQLPLSKAHVVVSSGGVSLELMRCDEVMFFRPLGQCMTPKIETTEEYLNEKLESFEFPIIDGQQPIVALLDGLPFSNHEALTGRITVDDPDDLEALYGSPSEQVHGTSMASIIIHGDLNHREEPALSRPLYVRPILAPGAPQFNGTKIEQIPPTYLPIDLVHRAVKRMKEGEPGIPPEAPEITIINLSVGDPYRLFDTQVSPWARMLDWLSLKYNVLFVVSAGNVSERIHLEGIKEDEFGALEAEDIEALSIKAIARQKHIRRMMSPAEAINALSISSSHDDKFDGELPINQVDVFKTVGMFSPINPITLGKKNSVKPELLMPGGRQSYINKSILEGDDVVLQPATTSRFGPGVKTALPSPSQGAINSYGYTAGTSNAAALATRRLAFLYETLEEIKQFGGSKALSFASDALLLKALLAHGAEHIENASNVICQHLKDKSNSRTFKSDLNQYFGFGIVNEKRIHGCQSNQVTLIHTGIIKDGSAHEYSLPLPHSLAAETVQRRLVVTVAWFAPVNHGHQDYRGAQLWATPAHDVLNTESGDYYHSHLRNGTIFHEVKKGNKAAIFTKGDKLAIQVHCYGRAGFEGLEVPYALIVTLDTPGNNIPVYEEVKKELEVLAEQTA